MLSGILFFLKFLVILFFSFFFLFLVLELSFDDVLTNQSQSDWEENNPESSHYIFNKPDIINNFQYTNDNLICLSDDRIVQTVSLKHHHKTEDITDFDHDVDIDLNELLERLTENIRSS